MSFLVKKNNARSTIAMGGGFSDVATVLTVSNGSVFPATGDFLITIWDNITYTRPGSDPDMEICRVKSVSSNDLTVIRAQEGTSSVAHANASSVDMFVTAGVFNETLDQNVRTTSSVSFPELSMRDSSFVMTAAPLVHGGVNYDLGGGGAAIVNNKANIDVIINSSSSSVFPADGIEDWGVALCSIAGGAQYGTIYFKNFDFIGGTNPSPGTNDNDYVDTFIINNLSYPGTVTDYFHKSIWVATAGTYVWTNPDAKAIVATYTDPPTFTFVTANYLSRFRNGASLAGNLVYILPTNLGSPGAVLTDVVGDGVLSWEVPV